MNFRDPPSGLEVLTHLPSRATTRPPLLFVHGAFVAAWCWEEHFLPYFAEAGHAAHAISLSGHGASRGRERLDSLSISDYVDDVHAVACALPAPPVLIGHSMGGFVVQKYLERHPAPAAVLMCPVPPQGLMMAAFGLLLSKPGLMRDINAMLSGGRTSLDTMREAMFAQEIAIDDLKRFLRQSQPESHRAIWDMSLFNLPNPSRVLAHLVANEADPDSQSPARKGRREEASSADANARLLVLGAEHDHLMPASAARMAARAYDVEAKIFPGMGHGLMLEKDWRSVADHILSWLKELPS